MDNPYPLAWAALLAAGAALEGSALLRKKGPATLSSNVWRVLDAVTDRSRLLGWTARLLLLGGLTMLGVHLAFEWPR